MFSDLKYTVGQYLLRLSPLRNCVKITGENVDCKLQMRHFFRGEVALWRRNGSMEKRWLNGEEVAQ
jgi:hypothetical protein